MAVPLTVPQLLVLDPRVAGWGDLMRGTRPGVATLLLDPARDGIAQIVAALADTGPVAAIHLVDHGSPGRLRLGATELDAAGLGRHAAGLAAMGAGLVPGGALLLWGCSIAAGPAGAALVGQLSRALGRDVAASDDLTGNPADGGDWVLEVATGAIGLAPADALTPAALRGFAGVLAVTSVTGTNGTYGTGDEIQVQVHFANPVLVLPLITPTLALNVGGTTRLATYSSGSGTDTLTFSYTVQPGDNTTDLATASAGALNGLGGILDLVGGLLTALGLPVGNLVGSLVQTTNIIIDTLPPAAPVVADFSTGGINLPGFVLTNQATPAVHGTAEAGATVTIREGATVLGSATANGSGAWSMVLGSLGNGVHNLAATAVDTGGNSSLPSLVTATVDLVAPAPATVALALGSDSGTQGDTITNVATPSLTGSAASGSVITVTEGGVTLGSATAVLGSYLLPLGPLAGGTHSLVVTTRDTAGNAAAPQALSLTIDLTPPAAPTAALVSDSGVAGDGITSDTTPDIGGTGAAGATIAVMDGLVQVGTATVSPGGSWSATLASLGSGPHALTVLQTDPAGNVSSGALLPVTIDTAAPAPPTLLLGGGTTGDTTPTLSGLAEPGATVLISENGVTLGSAQANLLGGWSITLGTLAQGAHSLSLRASDAAGNLSAAAIQALTVDLTPPAAPTAALALASDSGVTGDGVTNSLLPVVTGTGDPGSSITVTLGGVTVGTATVGGGGSWSATLLPLLEGPHSLLVTATDAVGNVSTPTALAITVDLTAPAAPTAALVGDSGVPGDGITSDATPDVGGTGAAGATITIMDGLAQVGSAIVTPGGSWSTTLSSLGSGPHALTVRQTDPAGNASPGALLAVTIDTAAPAAPSVLLGGGTTGDTTPTLTGLAEPGATVLISEGGVTLGSAQANLLGSWTATLATLAQGAHSLSLRASDAAGNLSAATIQPLVVDITPPAAPTAVLAPGSDSGVPGDGVTNAVIPVLTGTGDPGSSIAVTLGGLTIGTATVDGGGTWSAILLPLTEGPHSLLVTAADAVGNVSAPTALSVTIDLTAAAAPTASLLSDSGVPGDGLTNDSTPDVGGTGVAGSTITVMDGLAQVGTATVTGAGTWSTTLSSLAGGLHALTVRQTDAAGNGSIGALLPVTIDTTPPAAPSLVQGGGTTGNPTPTLSGLGEPGSTVVISENGTTLGSAAVNLLGGWSATLATLGAGAHSLSLQASDAAGNLSTAVVQALTVDLAPPPPPTAALAPGSDSGVAGDGVTNIAIPVLTGSAEAGARIAVTLGGVTIGSATANGGGAWSATLLPLLEGPHSLLVTATDAVGNVSAPTALSVTIDLTAAAAPTASLLSDSGVPGDGITNDATPDIGGTGVAGSTITVMDGLLQVGTATVTGAGTWSTTLSSLAGGSHLLAVRQVDAAGNASAGALLPVTVDIAPPAAPSLLAGGGTTNDPTPTLTGLGEPGSTVVISESGVTLGTAQVNLLGGWSATLSTLADGAHSLSLQASDVAGNLSAATPLPLVVDLAPPAPPTAGLAPGSDSGVIGDGVTNNLIPVLAGTAEAGASITVTLGGLTIGSATADGGGLWSATLLPLLEGPHSLLVTATDAAGNVSTPTALSVTIDTAATSAPTASLLSDSGVAGDGITNDPTPDVGGTGVAGSTITILDGLVQVGSATVTAGGSWTTTLASLGSGPHLLAVVETDQAANVSGSSLLAVTIDTAAPAPPSLLAGGGTTNDTMPTLFGLGEPGATVVISEGGTTLGTAQVNLLGNWTATLSTLADGAHSLSLRAMDVAGNLSTAVVQPLLVDATPPAPPVAALTPGSDSGTPGDGVTNIITPVLAGTAEAGASITVTLGAVTVGTATANGSGAWSATLLPLPEGAHALQVTATDAAGNVSAPAGLSVTIDLTPPLLPGAALGLLSDSGILGDGITNIAAPVVSGLGEAGGSVTLLDGLATVGTAVVNGSGQWSTSLAPLGEGLHTLLVVSRDAAGNASLDLPLSLTIDLTAPAAPVIGLLSDSGTPGDNITNIVTPVVSGSALPGALVTVTEGLATLGSTTADGLGNWSMTLPVLAQGAHALLASVADAAGNVASTPLLMQIDTLPPTAPTLALLSDSGLPGDGLTNIVAPLVGGTGVAGTLVTVQDGLASLGTATVDGLGQWSLALPALASGLHALTATARDAVGNVSLPTLLPVTIDGIAPLPPVIALLSDSGLPGDGITNDPTPTVSGLGEPGGTVTITANGLTVGTAVVNGLGAWSATLSTLPAGPVTLSAVLGDAAGNVSAAASLPVVIDTTPPPAPTITLVNDTGTPGDRVTASPLLALSGTGEPLQLVTISEGGVVLGTALVDALGNWSTTLLALGAGAHSLTASQTDAAGNPASGTLAVTIDLTAPLAPLAGLLTDTGLPGDGITSSPTPTIGGTAEPGALITVRDGLVPVATALADGSGAWSLTLPALGEGTHTLGITATDLVGLVSSASTLVLGIDLTAPLVPTLQLLSDSGVLGDAITSDVTPTLGGIAEAGRTVTVSQAGTVLGTAVADGTGAWSMTLATLSQGLHPLVATVQDAAGLSTASALLPLVIDTLAPLAPTIGLGSDSGTLGDGLTNIPTPQVGGITTPLTLVTVTEGLAVLGTTLSGADGSWSMVLPLLAEGPHALVATIADAAGNVASAALPVTIDTLAGLLPTVTLVTDTGVPGDGITNSTAPVLTGTGDPGASITISDGGLAIATATVGLDGNWTTTLANRLSGLHSLAVRSVDAAGNVSLPRLLSFVVDTAAATLGLTGLPAAGTYDTVTPLLFTVTPSEAVAVDGLLAPPMLGLDIGGVLRQAVYDPAASTASSLVFRYLPQAGDVDLDGITLRGISDAAGAIRDLAGNAATLPAPFNLTLAGVLLQAVPPPAPVVTGLSSLGGPILNGLTNSPLVTVAGTGQPGATITLAENGVTLGQAVVGLTGQWLMPLASLAEGVHGFTVIATDIDGSSAPTALPLTIDLTPASHPLLAGFTAELLGKLVSGTAEPGALVTLLDDSGATIASGVADLLGNFAILVPDPGAVPRYPVTAIATDLAGNASLPSAALDLVQQFIDGTPVLRIAVPGLDGWSEDRLTVATVDVARLDTADIPIAGTALAPVLTASLPGGVGLVASAPVPPDAQLGLAQLGDYVAHGLLSTLERGDAIPLSSGARITDFIAGLPDPGAAVMRGLVLTGDSADGRPVTITGDGTPAVLLLDATGLDPSTPLVLDNDGLALILGAATVVGGTGTHLLIGDDAAQSVDFRSGGNTLFAGGGNDLVLAAGGNDRLDGEAGDDRLAGGGGEDQLAGGLGADRLLGGRSDAGDWAFTMAPDGSITAVFTADGGPFSDGSVAAGELVQSGAPALGFLTAEAGRLTEMVLLYESFDRMPDLRGLSFWSLSDFGTTRIADEFLQSPEGQSLFGEADDGAFVAALYDNIFGRAPDPEGAAFFADMLAGGTSRAQVLASMALSPEHRDLVAGPLALGALTQQGLGWFTGSGDDRLTGGLGDDRLVGGDGTDTAVYAGSFASQAVSASDGLLTIAGPEGTDILSGIERVQFADGLLLTDRSTAADTIYSLYQALLGRAADIDGFDFWTGQLQAGTAAGVIATQLANSAEGLVRIGQRDSVFWAPANGFEAELPRSSLVAVDDPAVMQALVEQHLPVWQTLIGAGYFFDGVA